MSVDVTWEQDGLAVITMGWPERRNALGPDQVGELARAVQSVVNARAVVLRADGPAFCAGGDLEAIADLASQGRDAVRNGIYSAFHAAARALWGLRGISFAAIDGPAVGLGADLALLCSVRCVGPSGWMDQGWARIGLVPGTGGAWLSAAIAGRAVAWDFITSSGTRWDAAKLEASGLAVRSAESGEAEAFARARRVLSWPEETVWAYRSLLRPSHEGYEEHLDRCLEFQSDLLTSPSFAQLADRVLHPAGQSSGSRR